MAEEFRLKNIDETRNYFIEEINQNDLVENICTALGYSEHLFIL